MSSAQVAFRRTLEKEAKGVESDIAVPKFKQRKWESDGAYVRRMEQEAQHVLFLSKNQASRQPEAQAAPRKEKSERKKACVGLEGLGRQGCGVPGCLLQQRQRLFAEGRPPHTPWFRESMDPVHQPVFLSPPELLLCRASGRL